MAGKHASAATRVLIVEDDAVFRVPLRAVLAARHPEIPFVFITGSPPDHPPGRRCRPR